MLLRTVFILTLLNFARTQCNVGCLRCSSTNTCLLCDTTNKYVLSNGACSLATDSNCLIFGQSGVCVQCKFEYYVDPNTNKCLNVAAANAGKNCAYYSSTQNCLYCNPQYYPSGGSCTAVVNSVQNCAYYFGDAGCLLCSPGYVLALNQTSCVQSANAANCLFYTFAACGLCNTNFTMNYNSYFNSFGNTTFLNSLINYKTTGNVFLTNAVQLQVCQGGTISNCISYSNPTNCTQCAANFYLLNNTCFANPLPVISACVAYSSLTTCTNCKTGFFLNQNKCSPIVQITGCATYSTSASSTTCIQCDTTTYLSSNTCVARVNSASISNCQTLTVSADTCAVCSQGYVLSGDSLACLTATSNCVTYQSGTNLNSAAINCTLCAPTYFMTLDPGTNYAICNLGSTAKCAQVTANADTCTVCQNGYYLANSLCVAHVNIPNCVTYHSTQSNTCTVCATGFYNFKYSQVCQTVSAISGCSVYAANGLTCTTCLPGYYSDGNGNCPQIPTSFTNCVSYTNPNCVACAPGFMVNTLVSPQVCVAQFDYLTTNCILDTSVAVPVWDTPNNSLLVCSFCGPNMRPYTPAKSEAVCVLTTQLPLYSGFVSVPNCIRYGISYANTPGIVCMQCAQTMFISNYNFAIASTTATTCVSTCQTSGGQNTIIPDDLLGFANICMPTTSNGGSLPTTCQKLVRTTTANLGAADFVCLSASTGNSLVFAFPSNGIDIETNILAATDYKTASVDYNHGFSLADSNTLTIVPRTFNMRGQRLTVIATPSVISGVFLTNCDKIWQIGSSTQKGSAYRSAGGSAGAYSVLSGGQYSCLRCSFGFRPQFTITGLTANNPLPSCASMGTACQSSATIFGGLLTYLNALVSCHVCSQISGLAAYPTLYLEIDATTGSTAPSNFLQFALPNVNTWTQTGPQGFSCSLPPTTVTVSNTAATVGNQVSNCAIFGVFSPITTYSSDPNSSNINSFCLACSTGYFPIYFGTKGQAPGSTTFIPPYAVTSCVASNMCDPGATNTPFNSCGRCSTAQQSLPQPVYYAYTDFRLINCLQVNTANCYIILNDGSSPLSSSAQSPNSCGVCMAGYFRNEDRFCETLTVPNQANLAGFGNAFFVNYYVASTKPLSATAEAINIRISYQLSFVLPQYGVTACGSSYTLATPAVKAAAICLGSSYVQAGVLPQQTNFILNCLQYWFALSSGKLVCQKCKSGYIPTSSYSACVTIIPQCLFSQTGANSLLCSTCVTGFRNVGGVCSTSVINNCATYVNNENSYTQTTLKCQTCASGFYLAADQLSCIAGKITNCATYTQGSATACLTCQAGFLKLTLTVSNIIYCYPIPSSLNCAVLADQSSAAANNAQIQCTTCLSTSAQVYGTLTWNAQTTSSLAQTICMPFNSVANCASYSQTSTTINQNSFACTNCTAGFYLNTANNVCVTRTVQPINCTSYSITADVCTGCSGASFLAANGLSCVAYPNGIFNCLVYTSATTCSLCASGSYLSNNQCLTSTFISNCATYSGNNVCSACAAGFFLQNPTTCVAATATGCLNYTSVSACGACPPGSSKVTTNGVTNCVATNVPNCATINPNSTPVNCQICNSGYYADNNGTCQPVAAPISNCLVYSKNVTCSICNSGSVLNPTGTQCVLNGYSSSVDPNCLQSSISLTPLCAVCDLGFVSVNGTCTACAPGSMPSGCWSCDPNNQTNCLFCKPGYYQTSSGGCSAVPSNQTNTTPVTPNSIAGPLQVLCLLVPLIITGLKI